MMQENLKVSKQILRYFKTIRIMDWGYVSLADMYYSNANEDKFIVRLKNKDFKKERENHDTNDFVINIGYEYNRVKHYKDNNPEVYNYLLNGRFNKRKNCKYTIRYRGNRDTRY
jgi:hypothetical protein